METTITKLPERASKLSSLKGYSVCQICGALYNPDGKSEDLVESIGYCTGKGATRIICHNCKSYRWDTPKKEKESEAQKSSQVVLN